MSRTLTAMLGLSGGGVAAVAGCGGKTGLIRLLAEENRAKKVLISPTTKIYPLEEDGVSLARTPEEWEAHQPHTGIQCMGRLLPDSGKLGPLPEPFLRGILDGYDLALLEADGSRGLPCKGWQDGEPVIPDFCTHTIGVVSLRALGCPADERLVLRLTLFLELTGLKAGEPITSRALADMVCAPGGMFRGAVGERCLVVNQVEDGGAAARDWLRQLGQWYPGFFSRIVYVSVHQNIWREESIR